MDTSLVVSVIAGSSGLAVAALSYLFTKAKEREADFRKWKYEQYKQFVASISGITGTDSTAEGNRVFAEACNTLHLIGSKGVLDSMHVFQDYSSKSNQNKSIHAHNALVSKLIWEIRKDTKMPKTAELSDFTVRLWCSGTQDDETRTLI